MRILSLEHQPEVDLFITLDMWLTRPTQATIKIFVRKEGKTLGHACTINVKPKYSALLFNIVVALKKEKNNSSIDLSMRKAIAHLIVLLEYKC